jgi:urocanate hydratase
MLFEAQKAGANVLFPNGEPRYKSYIESILGAEYFNNGFSPYRWMCTSGDPEELFVTDKIAEEVL